MVSSVPLESILMKRLPICMPIVEPVTNVVVTKSLNSASSGCYLLLSVLPGNSSPESMYVVEDGQWEIIVPVLMDTTLHSLGLHGLNLRTFPAGTCTTLPLLGNVEYFKGLGQFLRNGRLLRPLLRCFRHCLNFYGVPGEPLF